MVKYGCYKCPNRTIECHIDCLRYKEYKTHMQQINDNRNLEKYKYKKWRK